MWVLYVLTPLTLGIYWFGVRSVRSDGGVSWTIDLDLDCVSC